MNTLIIITGYPGTGKSHLAALLQARFPSLEPHSYDTVKEQFWDRFGFQDAAEKLRCTQRSLQWFFAELAVEMLQRKDLLIEYPFHTGHVPALKPLVETYGYQVVTLCLTGDPMTIYQRSIQRDRAGQRHPGHMLTRYHCGDRVPPERLVPRSLEDFLADIASKNFSLGLGRTISLDVTDFSRVDYDAVLEEVAALGHWG